MVNNYINTVNYFYEVKLSAFFRVAAENLWVVEQTRGPRGLKLLT